MARLPVDAGDSNVWGQLLNEFLLVGHNADGAVKVVPSNLGLPMSTGEIPYDRRHIVDTAAGSSGDVQLTYFVACKTETITNLAFYTGATVAATVTLAKFGVYSVAGNGDLTLLHSTASDTGIFSIAHTRYQRALTTSWAKVAGTTYAVGHIVVATTPPTTYGSTTGPATPLDAIWAREPRISGVRVGQTDLPASITSGNVAVSRRAPFFEAIP